MTDPLRLFGRQWLVEQGQGRRPGWTEQTGQEPGCPTVRDETDPTEGKPEAGVLGGKEEVEIGRGGFLDGRLEDVELLVREHPVWLDLGGDDLGGVGRCS